MAGGRTTDTVRQKTARTKIDMSALQGEIRTRFLNLPVHKALGEVLKSIGVYFGADYTAVHARLGAHMLSEEWCRDPESFQEPQREVVNEAMLRTISTGASRCFRLAPEGSEEMTVLSAAMLDSDLEQAGAMSMILPNCEVEQAVEALEYIDTIAGYLALMISADLVKVPGRDEGFDPAVFELQRSKPSEHPIHLAFSMAHDVKERFDLGLVAIGFIHATRVKVVSVSGMDEVRASNPGVRLIRAAMEECLDRRETVLISGMVGDDLVEDDCRLHAEWSRSTGGDAVASFPLFLQEEVVGIVSVRNSPPNGLPRDVVAILATDLAKYGAILPLCRIASRSLGAHVLETIRGGRQNLLGAGLRRTLIKAFVLVGLLAWLCFGSMDYSLTVPCKVRAAVQRTISSPRDGVLADLFVRPGDQVSVGQLMAVLDDQDDELARHEIRAELATLDALMDKALEDGDSGLMRIHEAQRQTMAARLAVIDQNIALAQIRAPQSGIILQGDLREKLGSRIPTGEPLFILAQPNRIAVELYIPEHLILDARSSQAVSFAVSARPGVRIPLEQPRYSPAGTVRDGINVFQAESTVTASMRRLAPGMEGYAHIEVGPRRVWWVLSHRIINWFRLRFWV
jgi:hypothetical protein